MQHADIVLPTLPPRLRRNGTCNGCLLALLAFINQPAIKPCMKQNAISKSLPCCRAPLIRWRRVPVQLPQEFDHSAGWIRSSATVWRKCSASLRGTICWTGRKRYCQVQPHGTIASSKHRQASMNLNLNWRRKRHTALPEYKPEAGSKLPFHLFTPHVQFGLHKFILWTGCGCSAGTVRLYPSFFRTEKGISERSGQSFQWHR